jgi:hypothetical protein
MQCFCKTAQTIRFYGAVNGKNEKVPFAERTRYNILFVWLRVTQSNFIRSFTTRWHNWHWNAANVNKNARS